MQVVEWRSREVGCYPYCRDGDVVAVNAPSFVAKVVGAVAGFDVCRLSLSLCVGVECLVDSVPCRLYQDAAEVFGGVCCCKHDSEGLCWVGLVVAVVLEGFEVVAVVACSPLVPWGGEEAHRSEDAGDPSCGGCVPTGVRPCHFVPHAVEFAGVCDGSGGLFEAKAPAGEVGVKLNCHRWSEVVECQSCGLKNGGGESVCGFRR